MPGYTSKVRVHEKYKVVGFISSGTYGRVYKAIGRDGRPGEFAIKKYSISRPYTLSRLRPNRGTGSNQTKKAR